MVLVIYPRDWSFVDHQLCQIARKHTVILRSPWVTSGPRWFVALCALAQGFWEDMQGRGIDVVHCYSAWPAGIIGAFIAWRLGKPCVVHEHLCPAERLCRLPLAVKVLETASRVVAPSESQANRLEGILGRYVHVVRNPIDAPTGTVPWERSFEHKRLVAVGRLEERKGFDIVINVMRFLPRSYVLYVIGEGPLRFTLMKQARELGVIVSFVGQLPHSKTLRWLASADCVVCPSRDESFGLVAAEACALGRPVVASPVGAHADYATVATGVTQWAAAIMNAVETGRTEKRDLKLRDFATEMSECYDVPMIYEASA